MTERWMLYCLGLFTKFGVLLLLITTIGVSSEASAKTPQKSSKQSAVDIAAAHPKASELVLITSDDSIFIETPDEKWRHTILDGEKYKTLELSLLWFNQELELLWLRGGESKLYILDLREVDPVPILLVENISDYCDITIAPLRKGLDALSDSNPKHLECNLKWGAKKVHFSITAGYHSSEEDLKRGENKITRQGKRWIRKQRKRPVHSAGAPNKKCSTQLDATVLEKIPKEIRGHCLTEEEDVGCGHQECLGNKDWVEIVVGIPIEEVEEGCYTVDTNYQCLIFNAKSGKVTNLEALFSEGKDPWSDAATPPKTYGCGFVRHWGPDLTYNSQFTHVIYSQSICETSTRKCSVMKGNIVDFFNGSQRLGF